MMVSFSRHELSRLSAMCEDRYHEAKAVMEDMSNSAIERICAKLDMEYMESISAKLQEVVNSDAKRIEVR